MSGKKFDVDDIVYAKWPGSTQYYKAIILDVDSGKYQVKFDSDDTVDVVQRKHLMTQLEVERPKSPSRKRSRSRSASPGRRRSRSRSPSRRKLASPKENGSPVARQSRSPARVGRTARKDESPNVKKVDSVSPKRVTSEKAITFQKEESKQSSVEEINSREVITSRVTSAQNDGVEKTTVTRRTTRSVTRALQEQEDVTEKKSSSCSTSGSCTLASATCCAVRSLSYLTMAIIGMVLPTVLLYGLYLSCSKKSCTMLKLPTIPPCQKFFNWKSTGYVFGWFIFQMLLSALPLGKVVTGPVLADGKARQHCLNGLSQFAISMATIVALVLYGKLPFKYLTVNYLSLITAAAIYSFVVSVVAYIVSRNASSKEPSNGFICDFTKGRVASPRIGNFDLKMYAFKTGAVSWMALDLVYSTATLQKNWKGNYSLLAILAAQGLYILDKLFSEEKQLHTASMKSSKVGYFFSMTNLLFIPFFCSLQTRYLVLRATSLPTSYCIIPLLIAASGLVVLVQSRNQKFYFRTCKYDAILAGWNYIITRNGKGILCDGWWSQLTHPNYFGDFLQAMGWALLCGTNNLLPWMNVLLRLPMLIVRAEQDNKACKQKYGPAWTEYRQKVKSKIFPLIY